MEVLMENLVQQSLVTLDNVQLKIEQKNSLPANAKKIIGVTCQLQNQNTNIDNNDVTLTGNIVTRVIFINEFDKFDSEDVIETFEKKITVKNYDGVNQVYVNAELINSNWHLAEDKIVTENILTVLVQGVKAYNLQIVSNLTGEVEVQRIEQQVMSFNSKMNEKFEITENIQLDALCEGVLGVDVNPNLKDISIDNGKVLLKGTMNVNVLGLKMSDNVSAPYNFTHEIDFAKSIVVNSITGEDLVSGNLVIDNVQMRIENNQKGAVLVLILNVRFNGDVYCNHKFNMVTDAISFDKELMLKTTQLNYNEVTSQMNTTIDIENNINLSPNSPYISRVVGVDGAKINDLQVTNSDSKVVLEGILAVNLLLENEDHLITGEHYEVPFQTYVRIDTLERDYFTNASIVPLVVNIKARRGTELLVDAKLGVCIQTCVKKTIEVVSDLEEGKVKVDDGSAIRIYIIGEKENLWDLAKRTNLSCASLLEQNPNLENGCTPGERIVVYRHENVSL